jgi:hypothetical protein
MRNAIKNLIIDSIELGSRTGVEFYLIVGTYITAIIGLCGSEVGEKCHLLMSDRELRRLLVQNAKLQGFLKSSAIHPSLQKEVMSRVFLALQDDRMDVEFMEEVLAGFENHQVN